MISVPSSVPIPVPGMCTALCEPHRPPSAGWQPDRAGAALRCAQLCRQCRFASCRARHPCQPLGCQPPASQLGPAPCGRRALDPTAPGSHLGCKLSRTTFPGGSPPLLIPGEGGGTEERGLGWPLLLLGVPCRAIPLHHPTGRGPRHGLWGPDVAPCDVGIPTFDPTVTAAPSPTCTPLHLNTGPTCSPLHRGAVPPQPAAPWQPHSTLCPGQYLSRWERAGGRCLDPGASRSREAPSQPQPSCTPRVCLRR